MRFLSITSFALFARLAIQAQIPDFTPPTPLFAAASRNDTAEVARLLDAGANPNEGRYIGFTPVFFPIIRNNPAMFRAMVAKGADVMALDGVGSTTLMWAAFNENGSPEIVNELLKLGVNPNTVNKMGDSALIWAQRRGQTQAVAALQKAGAGDADLNKRAVENAIALLQKSGSQFVRVSGCASCHHQSLPQMAIGLARERGYAVNQEISQQQVATVVAMLKQMRVPMEKATDNIPDPPITLGYVLLGLHSEGYPANDLTDAATHLIAAKQRADGSFVSLPARPPMESSDITATALAIRVLQLYGREPEAAVSKARDWLLKAKPVTTEELSMRLLGLAWTKADSQSIKATAKMLLVEQRVEGGWGQSGALESDAYATGQALYALQQSGAVTTADSAFQRGKGFLLRTQMADGSWLVRSRSFPFQPLKNSGFPHGKDQWISAAGTSWAAMALSLPPAESQQGISQAPHSAGR